MVRKRYFTLFSLARIVDYFVESGIIMDYANLCGAGPRFYYPPHSGEDDLLHIGFLPPLLPYRCFSLGIVDRNYHQSFKLYFQKI